MKTDNLVKSLQSYGIRAAAYHRPPMGKDVFALTILPRHPEGVTTINQGRAEVDVFGNKKRRQAVVTVKEPGRVVTRHVKQAINQLERPSDDWMKELLRARFPIRMPSNAKWSYASLKVSSSDLSDGDYKHWTFSAKVTARVGRTTTQHFLMGMDESHNFIAPLKEKPSTVQEAVMMLRPKGIRPGWVRQGEWFFEPTTAEVRKMLDEVAQSSAERLHETVLGGSTHIAKTVVRVKKGKKAIRGLYARGYVVDSRQGHHRSIFLPEWHKVIRNREIVMKQPRGDLRAARRRQTFD